MSDPVKLIVGLGNPGTKYEQSRHNAGFWFVERLAARSNAVWSDRPTFSAATTAIAIADQRCWLLKPQTYMNNSGRAVGAFSRYYQLASSSILVVHDELDLPVGTVRLKQGGGPGGNNGLRDVISNLGTNEFARLRLGVGHPGDRDAVTAYLLGRTPQADYELISSAIDLALEEVEGIVGGDIARAMNRLNRRAPEGPAEEN